jgi:DNA-binding CsgD family transcriptional regulator
MSDLLIDLYRFLNFLNKRPAIEELNRRYLQDFIFRLRPIRFMILEVSPLNKILVKHVSGSGDIPNNFIGPDYYNQLCKEFNSNNLISDLDGNGIVLNSNRKSAIMPISNGKLIIGLSRLDCEESISAENLITLKIYSTVISFYLYPTFHNQSLPHSFFNLQINPLTLRQKQIIAGFIEGKTNHDLAVDLGFSISTIRHETMAIFKLLGASDRKEAAKIAQEGSLI